MITLPIDQIRKYCQSQPIQRLSLFGSTLHDRQNETSDVDLLVEFMPEARITYFDMFDMQQAFAQIIGQEVDLRTPLELSRYFRESVVAEAMPIYERS